MADYSDHKKDQINLEDYLPEVYRSDLNKTVSEMVLNRHLTKDDTIRVTGYIGTGNPNAVVKRQIVETSSDPHEQAHRQAFQLAPTMHTKIGTVEQALSFRNFLKQLELQGVDIDTIADWASTEEFNWVPPINIDMLANYQDYFWDSSSVVDLPQYFTIENRCNKSSDKVTAYKLLMQQRGLHFPIVSIDFEMNTFVLEGRWDNVFSVGFNFFTSLSNTPALAEKYWNTTDVYYDGGNSKTIITVAESIAYSSPPMVPILGDLWYDNSNKIVYSWDTTTWVISDGTITAQVILPALFPIISSSIPSNTFTIAGKQDDIFKNGFVFATKDSTNVNIGNKFWTVDSSTYDESTYVTTITVQEPIAVRSEITPTPSFIGQWWYVPSTGVVSAWTGTNWNPTTTAFLANISLSEMLNVFQSDLNCKCYHDRGWDIGLWDDNNVANVVWNDTLLTQISHDSESDWLTHNQGNPTMVDGSNPVNYSLWYDTSTDQLKQYGDPLNGNPDISGFTPSWNVVASNFSAVLALTSSVSRWDETIGCDSQILNQWSDQNKWHHKTALENQSRAKRAQVPILEYDSRLEMNEWTEITRTWKYRRNTDFPFEVSDIGPSYFELQPIKGYQVQEIDSEWYIFLFDATTTANVDVDLTNTFVPGYKFRIVDDIGSNAVYTVEWSEFRKLDTAFHPNLQGDYMATVVKIQESVFYSVDSGGLNNARIIPSTTSKGDGWIGYHAHWVLDTTNIQSTPTTPQPVNYFITQDAGNIGTNIQVAGNPAYALFKPQVSTLNYGVTYQEFSVDVNNITDVDLVSTLQFNPNRATRYATPGSNDLRVYINGVRQYGTYIERTAQDYPLYTAVKTNVTTSISITYVTGITFTSTKLQIGDVIRIEVGAASVHDMGTYSVPVRTVENDDDFNIQYNSGIQPIYMSLTTYEKNEQNKISLNQYPLFNVYHLITGEVVLASPIITFTEKSTSPINGSVQRRILTSSGGIEFEFQQHLLDRDDNLLYGYRNMLHTTKDQVWYSPINSSVKFWDGQAWTTNILVSTTHGIASRRVLVNNTDPMDLWDIDHAMWLNSTTNKLYYRHVGSGSWVEMMGLVVNDADPTLQTVWKRGSSSNYIPQYVDKDRKIVAVGSPNGFWEVVKQWMYNPEHQNKKTVKLSQLITHFRTMLEDQPTVQGLISGGVNTKVQSEFDYSLGGTIKEFNGAFDTLISAINVSNVTPVGVIEYASTEYSSSVRYVRDIFNKSIIDLFQNYSLDTLLNFQQYVINNVIDLYEDNDYMAKIYGDTSAYDPTTGKGIRNWISTAALFGLTPYYRPHLIRDGEFMQIFHHDGHRSNVIFTVAEEDALARKIIALTDERVTGSKLGGVGSTVPPSTESDFLTTYGGTALRAGVFWYKTGLPRTFYRFEMYAINDIHPTFYHNGEEVPNGVMYYNTITHNVFEKVGLSWVAVTSPGSMDISPMWKVVDFQELLGELYLEIENRLYEICVGVQPVYDYHTLYNTPSKQLVYDAKRKKRFEEYVVNYSVSTPYANIQYRQTDAFSWNYYSSVMLTPPHAFTAPDPAACWQQLYTNWYGTPYPHLEPWKLQGFNDKPTWWDTEYLETNGSRRWKFTYNPVGSTIGTGMWENIRVGMVPAGRTYPDGRISTGNASLDGQMLKTYIYFCVNISNSPIVGGYVSDQLLPPYYVSSDAHNRSIFGSLNQVIAPDADYHFGDGNIIEWQWLVSPVYPYENAVIAFTMQPVKFLRAAFGTRYTFVDGLEVDTTFAQVYSHKDALFHGDMVNETDTYVANGLNQWYVNYNRYTGIDTSDDFRELWAGWTPKMTYQTNSIIDTSTLDIANRHFDVIKQDYNVILANSGAFKDLWVDAFNISVLTIPPAILQYNNQGKWKFELDSLASISREISYYDVKSYPLSVNTLTDVCFAHKYAITGIDANAKRFFVPGNETEVFYAGQFITIVDSSVNDGTYTVKSAVYDPSVDKTRVNVIEPVFGSVFDGYVTLTNFTIPWSTGDMVVLSSSRTLPAPLVQNTPYYIINLGTTFKLAETFNDALGHLAIDIVSEGTGTHTLSEISGSFLALGGEGHSKETWYHYALDKSIVRTITPPYVFGGMQTLINIIDGYAEYQRDIGITNSVDAGEFDYTTGRQLSWGLETERFIDWAYGLRRARLSINDRFDFTTNITDNTISFVDTIPLWGNGTAVQVSTTGSLPAPLDANETYYVVLTDTSGTIKLSASQDVSYTPFHVDLLTSGSGRLYIALKNRNQTYPQFEINPTRNSIWLNTPEGVLSNIIQGPYTDIRVRQTIFDQYGRVIGADKMVVYRQDKRSRIAIIPQLPNDVDPFFVNDPYNYIHLGGGHFFVEGYEHFLLFDSYTAGGVLIYDAFLGLHATKFEMDFFRKEEHTLRPTLGGYYLHGHNFYRNIEGGATDLLNFYDTYAGSEDSPSITHARSLVGYTGRTNYMELLNVNSKSQFVFHRGMLHSKGSVASVLAYVNSRRFIDAKIDEYWAVKLADFGDNRVKVYPEILLYATDGAIDDIRFEFIGIEDDPTDDKILDDVENKGFNLITFADDSRWNNFPEQRAEIVQPLFLDAELDSVVRIFASSAPPVKTRISEIDYWFDTLTTKLRSWNGYDWSTEVPNRIHATVNHIFWRHEHPCDDVRIVRRDATNTNRQIAVLNSYASTNVVVTSNAFTVKGDVTDQVYSNTTIVATGTANSGTFLVDNSWYDAFLDITYISVDAVLPVDAVGGTITYVYTDFDFYNSVHLKPNEFGQDNYFKINSEVVRIDQTAFYDIIHIYTVRPSASRLNPARLVDKQSNAVISQVTLWNPAYGLHYYKALHNIDVQKDVDPAVYQTSYNVSGSNDHFWNFAEVGTTWLDTSQMRYIPYYDDAVYPDINSRLYKWGDLAPFGDVKVYQWVRSAVLPSEWDSVALQQQGDLTISPQERVSGTAKKAVFKRERIITPGTIIFDSTSTVLQTATQLVKNGQVVFVTADSTLPESLDEKTQYQVVHASQTTPQTFKLADLITDEVVVISSITADVEVVNVGRSEALDGSDRIWVLKMTSGTLIENDKIKLSTITGGTLPSYKVGSSLSVISASTEYVVTDVVDVPDSSYQTFRIKTTSGVDVVLGDPGIGNVTATVTSKSVNIVPSFNNDWTKQVFAHQRIIGAWLTSTTIEEPTITWDSEVQDKWKHNDVVDVYLNGTLIGSYNLVYNTSLLRYEISTAASGIVVVPHDYIDVVRPIHSLTAAEMDFDPDKEDDGVTTIQWKEDYEYSESVVSISASGSLTSNYYFWVERSSTQSSDTSSMSLEEIRRSLVLMPEPYFIVQKPLDSYAQVKGYGYDQPDYGTVWSMGELPEFFYNIPIMYRQAVIRNVSEYINDNNRYMLQFTRDMTLRDDLQTTTSEMNLKEKHSEWLMFRQNQSNNLPINLWDKLTESLAGVSLLDGTPVPSLDRILYDDRYGTETRYGLTLGQTFVDKTIGLATLLSYLQDPTRDFTPVDIDNFFLRHNFTTPSGVILAMTEIYNTFGAEHVNGIWFEMLHDALSSKSKYKGLMKTSWVALHGIRILEVNGIFDD